MTFLGSHIPHGESYPQSNRHSGWSCLMNKFVHDDYNPPVEREMLRHLADNLIIPIYEFDTDLHLVYANRMGLLLLNADASLIEKRPHIDQFIAEEFRTLVHTGLKNLSSDRPPVAITIRIVRQDEVEIPVEASAQRVYDRGVHCGYVAYLSDIRRRSEYEAKAESMNSIMQFALEHSLAGVLIVGTDYKFEYVNDRLCEILGRTRGEILHHDFREFLHPDSIALVEDRYIRRQRGEEIPSVYEFKIIHKAGHPIDVKIFSTVTKTSDGDIKTVAHLYEITDEVKKREELIASEQRFRSLVENMRDGLAVDDVDGVLTYVNDSLARMMDYSSPREIIGLRSHELFIDVTPEMMAKKLAARQKGISEQYEANLVSKTGRIVPVIVSASPLFDAKNNYVGSFAIFSDMTGLRSAEAYTTFLLDLLLHDIGNQLQLIMGGIELCESALSADTSDRLMGCMQYIRNGTERCMDLIRKVRRAEESREQPLVPTDLSQVVNSEVELLRRLYSPNIVIDMPQNVMILADGALSQVIWNLLENAVRHNPRPEKSVWVSGKKTTRGFEISIADNGPGLSDREKEQLFKSGRRFGGVGLYIVRTLAQKYRTMIKTEDRIAGDSSQGLKVILTFKTVK